MADGHGSCWMRDQRLPGARQQRNHGGAFYNGRANFLVMLVLVLPLHHAQEGLCQLVDIPSSNPSSPSGCQKGQACLCAISSACTKRSTSREQHLSRIF
jgi:hypothetical protein